jgi:hypothetical protein
MWLTDVLALALLLPVAPAAAGSSTVSGTYTVKGTTYTPAYVYAVARPDALDSRREGLEILFTTRPVPDSSLTGAMPGEGPRVSATVGADGRLHGVVLVFEGGSISSSGTQVVFAGRARDATRVSGRLFTRGELEAGSAKGRFDLTFSATIFRPPRAAPATGADRAAAARSPQAKAYTEYLRSIHAGDLASLRKVVTQELAVKMSAPEFKDQLAFLQQMAPKAVDFVRVTETGDSAALEVETKTDAGRVDCAREAGVWKVGKQRWSSRK